MLRELGAINKVGGDNIKNKIMFIVIFAILAFIFVSQITVLSGGKYKSDASKKDFYENFYFRDKN